MVDVVDAVVVVVHIGVYVRYAPRINKGPPLQATVAAHK